MTFLKLMAKSLVCCTVLYLACGPLTAMAVTFYQTLLDRKNTEEKA